MHAFRKHYPDKQKEHIARGCFLKSMGKEGHKTQSKICSRNRNTHKISILFYTSNEPPSDEDHQCHKYRKSYNSLL